jgi:hypothetical protein
MENLMRTGVRQEDDLEVVATGLIGVLELYGRQKAGEVQVWTNDWDMTALMNTVAMMTETFLDPKTSTSNSKLEKLSKVRTEAGGDH